MIKRAAQAAVVLALCGILVVVGRQKLAAQYSNHGIELLEQEKLSEAKSNFQAALSLNDAAAQTWEGLATVMRLQGELPRAVDAYKKAVAIDPSFAQAYAGLAQAYRAMGQYPLAMAAIAQGLKVSPGNAQLGRSGNILAEEYTATLLANASDALVAQDAAGGLAQLDAAIESNASMPEPYYLRASYYIWKGRYEEAQEDLDKSRVISPDSWVLHKLQGDIFNKRRQFSEALQEYLRARALVPQSPALDNNIALMLMRLERYADALSYAQAAAEQAGDNPDIRNNLASIYRDNGMPEQAKAEYEKVLALRRTYPGVYDDLGDLYKQGNDLESARNAYTQEISRDTAVPGFDRNPDVLNDLARAYVGLEDYATALDYCTTALSLNPSHMEAVLTQARVLEKMDRLEEALTAYEKASLLWKRPKFIQDKINLLKERVWKK